MSTFMLAHFGIIEFWAFLFDTVFIVLLPGPNPMYVLSVTTRRGVHASCQSTCGALLGNVILMVLSAAGVASLLETSPAPFYVVKYIGAAYLAWIGLQMLRDAIRNWRVRKTDESVAQDAAPTNESHPFKKALIISLLNPKAILFFISFFIQFVDPHYVLPVVSFVVLGLVCQICSSLYLTTIIFVGAWLAAAFHARRRLSTGMSSDIGVMFIGFPTKLATATLS